MGLFFAIRAGPSLHMGKMPIPAIKPACETNSEAVTRGKWIARKFQLGLRRSPGQAVRLRSCLAWRVHLFGAEKSMRLVAAVAFYFLIVFGVGFLLGPVRVFWLEPRLGEAVATLCEAPFLLCAMLLAARWLPRALSLRPNIASLAIMGVGALLLQQFADFAVGTVLRGITPAQQLARLSTPAGLIYVALLLAFVAMPVLANWPRRQPADARSMQTALHVVKVARTG
jgi:hypothetical protein